MKEIWMTIGLVALAMVLLCIRVLLKKNGKFSSQHIAENKKMRERGIHCATSQDREARRAAQSKIDVNAL